MGVCQPRPYLALHHAENPVRELWVRGDLLLLLRLLDSVWPAMLSCTNRHSPASQHFDSASWLPCLDGGLLPSVNPSSAQPSTMHYFRREEIAKEKKRRNCPLFLLPAAPSHSAACLSKLPCGLLIHVLVFLCLLL